MLILALVVYASANSLQDLILRALDLPDMKKAIFGSKKQL